MAVSDFEAYVTDEIMTMHVRGGAPYCFLAKRFGDGMDMRTLFDPAGFSDIKMKAANLAAGGAGSVVVVQLRR